MSDTSAKPALFVKNKDAKKGSLWNDIANKRIVKQHGGFDIPEGDLHAIPKYTSPVDPTPTSSEETQEVLTDIEKEIQQLKEKNVSQTSLPPQYQKYTDPYENEEGKNYEEYEDEQ